MLDNLSEAFHEDFTPETSYVLQSLDGDVHSQGIKIDHRDWLDMGSESWSKTDDKLKAYAFQAAIVAGWDTNSIKDALKTNYKHLTDTIINITFETLQELSKQFPVEVETVAEVKIDYQLKGK